MNSKQLKEEIYKPTKTAGEQSREGGINFYSDDIGSVYANQEAQACLKKPTIKTLPS